MATRRAQIEKEKEVLREKAWAKNNPIFTTDHLLDFYEMFLLFSDPRTKRADIRDILVTAKTLGLHNQHQIVANALEELAQAEKEIDFETFIKDLTEKLGNPFDTKGRQALFNLIDQDQKEYLTAEDLTKISDELGFKLSQDEIQEVIHNVAGYEADQIPYDKFEKYLAKKIHRRNQELELAKNK